MNYREKTDDSKIYKENYRDGFLKIIKDRKREMELKRKRKMIDALREPEKCRSDLKKMLGWPLVDYETDELPQVKSEKLSDEEKYSIYRMQFEILDGLTMTGLFFRAKNENPTPLIIVQHGGLGTPEHIADFYGEGTSNYNKMLERVVEQGVHVFAPQLLLWDKEKYGIEYDRNAIDASLKRLGSSITAVEIFGIQRIIDYFENENYVLTFGMVGLSYGGFYTLYTTAIDTRIEAAVSCSFFNTRDVYDWPDWTWFNSAELFDDAEVAALIYPRWICIEVGENDELFDYKNAIKSFNMLKKLTARHGVEWLEEMIIFDGNHEFCLNDTPIEKMIDILYLY